MSVSLQVDVRGVAWLTLNRTTKRNALDIPMIAELEARVAELSRRRDVRVVVLRGSGGTFCAGADIADWVDPGFDAAMEQSRRGTNAFTALADLPQVTLGVVEGAAVGGGLELALACDLRLAADDAVLGLPELGLGNLPSWGGVARLVDIAGQGVARYLLLSGELIDGRRSAELLVVTSSHPAAELEAALDTTIERLLRAEPLAASMAKDQLGQLRTRVGTESAFAGFFALHDESRQRKQDFLDRKSAAKAARAAATNEGHGS